MKQLIQRSFALAACGILVAVTSSARDLDQLKVLYVGEVGSSRAKEIQGFLKLNVARVETTSRKGFDPKFADAFDVVVLDWPQSNDARLERGMRAPLGERDQWTKPTVLLGSAGLNLAVAWMAKGGVG